jgi:transcriptional regulator with XRE-family HTH domain
VASRSTNRKKAAARRTRAIEIHDDLGRQIRAHREQSGISLREFARRLGISPSAVSQIETGKARPSVSTLYAIISELDMSLDELFNSSPREAAGKLRRERPPAPSSPADPFSGEGKRVQRGDARVSIDLESGVRWERLTAQPDHDVDFLHVVYDVGGSSSQGGRFIRHSGREYGLVLSGTLEVTVGFDTYVLGPGDSICFESTVPHVLRNIGPEPARGVWCVIGRHDDDGPAEGIEAALRELGGRTAG